MIYGFGVRLGLAEKDDADNLLDVPVGDGSTDIKNRIEYYRVLGDRFDLRLLAESTIQLPDKATLRVPKPGELLPPSSSKEKLSRDLGDFREYDIEIGYGLESWRTEATWHRYDKGTDRYKSDKVTDTSVGKGFIAIGRPVAAFPLLERNRGLAERGDPSAYDREYRTAGNLCRPKFPGCHRHLYSFHFFLLGTGWR